MSHQKHVRVSGGTLNLGKTGTSFTSVTGAGTKITTGSFGTTVTTPMFGGGSITTHTGKTGTHSHVNRGHKH